MDTHGGTYPTLSLPFVVGVCMLGSLTEREHDIVYLLTCRYLKRFLLTMNCPLQISSSINPVRQQRVCRRRRSLRVICPFIRMTCRKRQEQRRLLSTTSNVARQKTDHVTSVATTIQISNPTLTLKVFKGRKRNQTRFAIITFLVFVCVCEVSYLKTLSERKRSKVTQCK